ncbi:hypothetical protein ACFQVC_11420 [Streptomyces monticola]|uniref:Metal-dependent phosphohydrolase n=1 Tax=Streptomyces monticola TaxID=2666263 RepID=A0ABW2JGB4_9ACTN
MISPADRDESHELHPAEGIGLAAAAVGLALAVADLWGAAGLDKPAGLMFVTGLVLFGSARAART